MQCLAIISSISHFEHIFVFAWSDFVENPHWFHRRGYQNLIHLPDCRFPHACPYYQSITFNRNVAPWLISSSTSSFKASPAPPQVVHMKTGSWRRDSYIHDLWAGNWQTSNPCGLALNVDFRSLDSKTRRSVVANRDRFLKFIISKCFQFLFV